MACYQRIVGGIIGVAQYNLGAYVAPDTAGGLDGFLVVRAFHFQPNGLPRRAAEVAQNIFVLQAGAQHGMHTLDQHLADLVKKGRISYDTGLEKCHNVEDYTRLAGRA